MARLSPLAEAVVREAGGLLAAHEAGSDERYERGVVELAAAVVGIELDDLVAMSKLRAVIIEFGERGR